jgi:hypothetical protein
MPEQKLDLIKNGEYYNLFLKDFKDAKGLEPGNYVIVEKDGQYAAGYKTDGTTKDGKPYSRWNCTVNYNGQKCAFSTFNEKEAKAFEEAGGVGDKVKITHSLYKNKKGGWSSKLTFEAVQ